MDRGVGEALLLPLVSAPPWDERPPGVDTTVGSVDVTGAALPDALNSLSSLFPPWLDSRRRATPGVWGGRWNRRALRPYEIEITPLQRLASGAPYRSSGDVSAVGWSEIAPETIADLLFRGHLPLMRPFEDLEGMVRSRPDPAAIAPAVDFLLRSHFSSPRMLPAQELVQAIRVANERWRGANELFARESGFPLSDVRASLGALAPSTTTLIQAALGHARLSGHASLESGDIRSLIGAREDSVAYLTSAANRKLVRAMLRVSSHVRSKAFETRLNAVKPRLTDPKGTSIASLYDALAHRDVFNRIEELEVFLDELRREGWLIQLSDRSYVWVGD